MTYRNLHFNGGPYRFCGQRDTSLQKHRLTSCYFYISIIPLDNKPTCTCADGSAPTIPSPCADGGYPTCPGNNSYRVATHKILNFIFFIKGM